ncbi:MAG: type II secretion system F family protein [Acidimicrobiales bacterium]
MKLLAAVMLGALAWAMARQLSVGGTGVGAQERAALRQLLFGGGRVSRRSRASFQVWLSQAGAAVTPTQFWVVSAGVGAVAFMVLLAITRTTVVSALPAGGCAAVPYSYWSAQRRKQAAARCGAWPDALRYLVGALGAGIATLHDGLEELAGSGPEPLRAPMARYVRMSARLGDRPALEAVRAELADPISDPVLLAFAGAIEEGTETVLRVLADLGSQIAADIQLADKIRTIQTQSRVANWGCFAMPYGVLVFLCATNPSYRSFFSQPVGLVLVVVGAVMSVVGLAASRRLVRPIAATERVFVESASPWAR